MRRIQRLFQGAGEFVRQNRRSTGGGLWSAGLFRRLQLRCVRSVRLSPCPDIFRHCCRRDVSGHTVAVVRPGISAACVLPLLPVFGGTHLRPRRDRGVNAFFRIVVTPWEESSLHEISFLTIPGRVRQNRSVISYALLTLFASVLPAFAGTHRVPNEEPIAKLKIPDQWNVREVGESLQATTGDGGVHVLVVPVEGIKVAESLGEAIRYVRNTGGIVIKADTAKHGTAQVKDKSLQTVSWDATARDQPIKILCWVLQGAEGKRLLMLFWGSPEAEKNTAVS